MPIFMAMSTEGLPALRAKWIRDRGDVEEIEGRAVTPIDDGYLSEKHARLRSGKKTSNVQRPTFNVQLERQQRTSRQSDNRQFAIARRPLRAQRRSSRHAAVVRAPRHHHARDGVHCDSRKLAARLSTLQPAISNLTIEPQLVRPSTSRRIVRREYSARNNARIRAGRSRARAAPSFRPTSIIPNSSR